MHDIKVCTIKKGGFVMFKRQIGKVVCILIVALMLLFIGQPSAPGAEATKQRQELLIGGGSAGGFAAVLAEGCAEAIRRSFPNWSVTSTIGEVASNIKLVHDGELQLTIAYPELVAEANKGVGTYKQPMPDIKMIGHFTLWPNQFVLLTKVPINTVEEWKQKKLPLRINVQKRGSGTNVLNERLLNAYGFTVDDIKSWGGTIRFEGGTRSMMLIKDGLLDGSLFTGACPLAALIELGTARNLKMVPHDPKIIQQLVNEYGYIKKVVPKGTYKWLTTDIPTVAVGAGIAASTKLEPGVVRGITRAFVEQIKYLRSLHKDLKQLSVEQLADIPANIIHPEARQHYESLGIKFEL
jgi:TRAP transporter TAXI family solute receptor